MTSIAAKLEELPTAAWLALAVLGFILWWPLGVVVLAYLLWSGRMMCCNVGLGRWNERGNQVGPVDLRQRPRSSGNQAFDDYRTETLRRLEEESRAFQDFVTRLRMAKDKAEFDQFMAERVTPTRPQPESRG